MVNESIRIKDLILRNRVIAEPIVSDSGDGNGRPTAETMKIYDMYSKSGVGMIVLEQHAVHPWGRNRISQLSLYEDEMARSLAPLTKLFRDNKTPVAVQLNFAGAGASDRNLLQESDFKLVSPSGLRTARDLIKTDSSPLELTEILQIVESFAKAARRAVTLAKYDGGVQIYACHGYLLGQFLSPLTNRRRDLYGGSLANRARLLFEVVEAVKAELGNHPLSVRLGASDQMPGEAEKGLTLSEAVWVAEQLAYMGVDWLGVSGNLCIYGLDADDRDTAYFKPYSKAIREAVNQNGLLVDCAGGIRSRQTAEELLLEGVCDFIGLGRPMMKDKMYLRKWRM